MELDAALVDLARAAGAKVLDGHAAHVAIAGRADRSPSTPTASAPIHARYAIGADGMWSPLRKMLGAAEAGYLGEWHAFRQYFAEVGPAAATQLWVWFEPDLLPGYAWSFPLAGRRANVGFGIPRGGTISTQAMKQLWPELLARPHIHAVLGGSAVAEAPHKAWPIPARIGSLPLTAPAGAVRRRRGGRDRPPDGRGHRPGAAHRRSRADAILHHGLEHTEQIAAGYREAVLRSLAADHHMSVALGKVLERPNGARGRRSGSRG